MKNYKIYVNGNEYDVQVEEVGVSSGESIKTERIATPVAKPAPVKKAEPVKKVEPVSEGSVTVVAPIPGVILNLGVKIGDIVEKGATLLVLEAMKMENEIMAPISGVVSEMRTKQGDSVNAGDILVVVS